MSDTDLAIDVQDVVLKLGRFTLGPISLQAETGMVHALIGANGAGKTTLIDTMIGLAEPDSGDLRILGLRRGPDDVKIKARVGYVSPNQNFAPWGTVGRALDFISGFYPDWDDGRCQDLLNRFGLYKPAKISTLSFGARTKLSLVMALSRDADLLLLDEPTVGLDAQARHLLFTELLKIMERGDKTILISSHDLVDLERIADSVILIHKGRVKAQGRMDALTSRFVQIDTEGGDIAAPGWKRLSRTGARTTWLVDRAITGTSPFTSPADVKLISETPLALEDLFLALTQD